MTKKKKIDILPWTLDGSLKNERDIASYLDAVIEEGDAALLLDAIGMLAKKRGIANIAKETGLGRESLYKTLSVKGDPHLSTLIKVLSALQLRLRFAAA